MVMQVPKRLPSCRVTCLREHLRSGCAPNFPGACCGSSSLPSLRLVPASLRTDCAPWHALMAPVHTQSTLCGRAGPLYLTLSCALGTPRSRPQKARCHNSRGRRLPSVWVAWPCAPSALPPPAPGVQGSELVCTEQLCARGAGPAVHSAGPRGPPGVPAGAVLEGQCPGQGLIRKPGVTSVGPQVSAELLMPPGEFIFLYQLV